MSATTTTTTDASREASVPMDTGSESDSDSSEQGLTAEDVERLQDATVLAAFQTPEGDSPIPALDIPVNCTTEQLELLINELLNNDEKMPYSFFVKERQVTATVLDTMVAEKLSLEGTLTIVYQPQALFRVRGVTRCSATMAGHSDAVLAVAFSPSGRTIASGSGDKTVRLWDAESCLPIKTIKSHKHWVLCVSFSPDGKKIATASKDSEIYIHDGQTGEQLLSRPLKGHTRWVMSLSWKPLHRDPSCRLLASVSKDCTLRVWDTVTGRCLYSASAHSKCASCVRWGGSGLIYTGGHDRMVKVWAEDDGKLVRSIKGHAHWVNSMALSTDHVIRTGAHTHHGLAPELEDDQEAAAAFAQERYDLVVADGGAGENMGGSERLVTASDDFTLLLSDPTRFKKPIARLTGHQQAVCDVKFSPNGHVIASAGFDKVIKLWNGFTGKFIGNLRGHVAACYSVAWSDDSRMLISCSKDATLKLWDIKKKRISEDLAGHADEVYCVAWSTLPARGSGGRFVGARTESRVVSGSKDRLLKIWRQ